MDEAWNYDWPSFSILRHPLPCSKIGGDSKSFPEQPISARATTLSAETAKVRSELMISDQTNARLTPEPCQRPLDLRVDADEESLGLRSNRATDREC